jgi:hydroxymethylglutaryl-CoA reductase (NADPH)
MSASDPRLDLIPRLRDQGYRAGEVAARRAWVEARTGVKLPLIGSFTIPSEQMRGNVENPIGAVQMPVGIAGPLEILGAEARGAFYVPLATTEGALVRSYERGMITLTRAGGVTARIIRDENSIAPVFVLDDVAAAVEFAERVVKDFDRIKKEAEATTRHGRLLRVDCHPAGREVIVEFHYHTGDAQGMNMIARATEQACRGIAARWHARRFYVFSGLSSEKRASGALLAGGKGKTVTAGARIPAAILRSHLHVTPEHLVDEWHRSVIGHVRANAVGFNAQYANGLAAMFIACGQDVANVANAAVGITNYEPADDGGVHVSVTLPSLTVATVGGGTALGTSRECLEMLGCAGAGRARRFAEIVAATLLAGEISMAAAIASGEFVEAHEAYGRNRPEGGGGGGA